MYIFIKKIRAKVLKIFVAQTKIMQIHQNTLPLPPFFRKYLS